MNRSCRPQATTQSWLTSTTLDSVIIFAPPYIGRCNRLQIDIEPLTFFKQKMLREHVENGGGGSDYPMNAPIGSVKQKGARDMKYILLMSGTKAGVDGYRAWSKKDIDAHMSVLTNLSRELAESGEFVATQGLAAPQEAKVV